MYKHTQIGWGMIVILGLFTLLVYLMGANEEKSLAYILLITMILFSSLTITVDDKFIKLRFGPLRFPRKTFKLTEVESCRPNKKIWYGIQLGIHFGPRGSLHNVSGMKVVELTMKNGKIRLIGTDEPEKLSEFIQNELDKHGYIKHKLVFRKPH